MQVHIVNYESGSNLKLFTDYQNQNLCVFKSDRQYNQLQENFSASSGFSSFFQFII